MLSDVLVDVQSYFKNIKTYDPVPIAPKQKSPFIKGWPAIEHFESKEFVGKNIGCRGTYVVPIDFDESVTAYMAVAVFRSLLGNKLVYDGRRSRPISHIYIYVPDGAPRYTRSESPFTRGTYPCPVGVHHGSPYVIELKHHRGLQAIMAPSTHPSGEELIWHGSQELIPAAPTLQAPVVEQALQCVWLARALSVIWAEGRRHDMRLWAGTWLRKSGLSQAEAQLVWTALNSVVNTDQSQIHTHKQEFFRSWTSEDISQHKGFTGIQELARYVLTEQDTLKWFEQIYNVWPQLRHDTQPVDLSTPLLKRLTCECTLITPAQRAACVYDPEMQAMCPIPSYKQRLGRIGETTISKRGAQVFTHTVDTWLATNDKRVALDVTYSPKYRYNEIRNGLLNTFKRGGIWEDALVHYRTGDTSDVSDSEIHWFIDWVSRVIPDQHERDTLLDWIAALLLWPEKLRGWAPYMMTHVHGIGRTSLLQTIQRIMGEKNARAVCSEALQTQFNDWAASGVLRFINELRESGSVRGVASKKLHSAITDSSIMLNRKYQPVLNVDNHGGYVLIANDVGDMHLTEESRRFFCISCGTQKPTKQQEDIFFAHAEDRDSLVRLAQWLLQREPRAKALPRQAPHSNTKAHVVETSRSGSEDALIEVLSDFSIVFTMQQLIRAYDGVSASRHGDRHKMLWGMLRSAGYTKIRSHKNRLRFNNDRVTVYVHQRDYLKAAKMSSDELRTLLEQNDKPNKSDDKVIMLKDHLGPTFS